MKALTICQPYAELIARGEKVIENRTWFTRYRGPLAIHAGLSRSWLEPGSRFSERNLPFGAVVAIADLVDCCQVKQLRGALATHKHALGPWCWVLQNVRRIEEPFPVPGHQGLWDVLLPEGALPR